MNKLEYAVFVCIDGEALFNHSNSWSVDEFNLIPAIGDFIIVDDMSYKVLSRVFDPALQEITLNVKEDNNE